MVWSMGGRSMHRVTLIRVITTCIWLGFLYASFQYGKQAAVDNVFELCYNGALIMHDERVVACFPMSSTSDEEKKELDKLQGA